MKLCSRKGFTLAELLIVMAIIVVLASVALPSFTRQLETSRETADVETLRNAYTDAYALALADVSADGTLDDKYVETPAQGGGSDVMSDPGKYKIDSLKFVQTKAGFQYVSGKIGDIDLLTNGDTNGVNTLVAGKTTLVFEFGIAPADATTTGSTYKKGDLYLKSITVS